MIVNRPKILELLDDLLEQEELHQIKSVLLEIKESAQSFKSDKKGLLNISSNGETINFDSQYFLRELEQILETKTLERTKYYLQRLRKSLTEIKTAKINDLNLNRWKEYDDLITDSLWVLDKRDNSGVHNASYWGNFIPQIPNQFLRRYTKKGEWVLDLFLGYGTTLIECQRLERNGIGVELQPSVAEVARKNLEKEKNLFSAQIQTEVIVGDSKTVCLKTELERLGIESVQLLIMHPPYWDIIKFSDDSRDISNAKTIDEFLKAFGQIVENSYPFLDKGRYLVLVIGDKYSKGEWIPLGFYAMQEVLKRGYKLKSTIVKNFEETKAKMNQKELWRYRALVGGFYVFKHEYIFLFKK